MRDRSATESVVVIALKRKKKKEREIEVGENISNFETLNWIRGGKAGRFAPTRQKPTKSRARWSGPN